MPWTLLSGLAALGIAGGMTHSAQANAQKNLQRKRMEAEFEWKNYQRRLKEREEANGEEYISQVIMNNPLPVFEIMSTIYRQDRLDITQFCGKQRLSYQEWYKQVASAGCFLYVTRDNPEWWKPGVYGHFDKEWIDLDDYSSEAWFKQEWESNEQYYERLAAIVGQEVLFARVGWYYYKGCAMGFSGIASYYNIAAPTEGFNRHQHDEPFVPRYVASYCYSLRLAYGTIPYWHI